MSDEIHFYACSPAVWRRVQAAAKAQGATFAEWAGRAVEDRLDRQTRLDLTPVVTEPNT